MPRLTRSSDLLSLLDGLYFIDQDTVDLASLFYTELRSTSATFGEDAIKRLVPHVGTLMTKLNEFAQSNGELTHEVEALQNRLSTAETRCMDLNSSFKGKSTEVVLLGEQYEADIADLNAQLSKCMGENVRLRERVSECATLDTRRMISESEERIANLTAERTSLLTSIEVLEADIKALRSELRRAETRARQRRTTEADDSLLAELLAAEKSVCLAADQYTVCDISQPHNNDDHPAVCLQENSPPVPHSSNPSSNPTSPHQDSEPTIDFSNVLLIGDSHMRYASMKCVMKGAMLECCPGGRIVDIKNRLVSYIGKDLSVVYIHVGANNLRKGYRGGPGYNGGHGKREALHSMADLLYTAKTNFPNSKFFLDSVLIRRDIGFKALHDFNDQLELMCNNFGVEFVEANSCVRRRDLSRDGVHFNRRSVTRLGSLFERAISAALWIEEDTASSLPCTPGEAESGLGLISEPGTVVDGSHYSRGDGCDASRVSDV